MIQFKIIRKPLLIALTAIILIFEAFAIVRKSHKLTDFEHDAFAGRSTEITKNGTNSEP